jgi:hypothetical protein
MSACTPPFRNARRQSGIGAIEFLLALPLLIALGLTAWQWALILQARQVLEHAAHEAVRSGARGHASISSIDQGFARGLTTFWPAVPGEDPESRSRRVLDRMHDARADNWMDWRQLSPTRQSFSDWAEPAIDPAGRPVRGLLEIPVDNLDARIAHTRPASGVSAWLGSEPIGVASGQTLRDASVLRIELQVALPLRVPIGGPLISAASGWPRSCRKPCLFDRAADALETGPRILLRVHAEARMQSPARMTARTPERTQSVSGSTAMSGSQPEEVFRRPTSRVGMDQDSPVEPLSPTHQDSAPNSAAPVPRIAAVSGKAAAGYELAPEITSNDRDSAGDVSDEPSGRRPLAPSEVHGEIWSPGACGITPG